MYYEPRIIDMRMIFFKHPLRDLGDKSATKSPPARAPALTNSGK